MVSHLTVLEQEPLTAPDEGGFLHHRNVGMSVVKKYQNADHLSRVTPILNT